MKFEDYGAKPPDTTKEKEGSVKDILADKKESALFGEYIKSQAGGSEVAERLFKGEQTSEDLKTLTEAKEQFLIQRKQVEGLLNALTPNMIDQLAYLSEPLKILVENVGAEGVHAAISSQLEMASMQNPDQFKNMLDAYTKITEKAKNANERIEKLCKDYGITSDEYLNILAETPQADEREKKLGDLLNSRMGRIKGILPKTRENNRTMRERQITKESEELNRFKRLIDSMRAEYDEAIRDTGDLLAVSINENESLQKAFSATLMSEHIQEEKIGGFKEMQGLMPNQDQLKKEWETGWTAAKAQGMSEDDYRKKFTEDKTKLSDKKGTWSDIVRQFLTASINTFTR